MTVAKDWIVELADAIQESYGVDTSADSARPALVELINKHSPFKRDVAYMPVPRCETCKHWTARGIRNYCAHPELKLHPSLLFVPPLETARDFGCVQWEEKL